MLSGNITTQRCPSFNSAAAFTAAATAVPLLPPVIYHERYTIIFYVRHLTTFQTL